MAYTKDTLRTLKKTITDICDGTVCSECPFKLSRSGAGCMESAIASNCDDLIKEIDKEEAKKKASEATKKSEATSGDSPSAVMKAVKAILPDTWTIDPGVMLGKDGVFMVFAIRQKKDKEEDED
jgi:hypothetical protein